MREWLGLDIGGTKVRQAVVAQDGFIKTTRRWAGGDVADPLTCRENVVLAWRADHRGPPLGVGIAIAARVDRDGYVWAAPNLPSWEGCNLVELFKDELDCAVHVLFDGTAALLGELWLGHPGIDNGFSMSIGTGIGGGLVVDGRVLHGAHGLSGMATSGLLRESAGLESIASGPAVAAASGVASGSEAVQQCRRRDARAVKAFASASQALYEAVATVTATVDVTTVIVAGGFGAAGFDLLFPERAIPAKYRWYPLVHDDVEVIPAVTGELAPLLGAVKYAILQECSKG